MVRGRVATSSGRCAAVVGVGGGGGASEAVCSSERGREKVKRTPHTGMPAPKTISAGRGQWQAKACCCSVVCDVLFYVPNLLWGWPLGRATYGSAFALDDVAHSWGRLVLQGRKQ